MLYSCKMLQKQSEAFYSFLWHFFQVWNRNLLHIVLLKCSDVQIAFWKVTSCDNQALVGCIPIPCVCVCVYVCVIITYLKKGGRSYFIPNCIYFRIGIWFLFHMLIFPFVGFKIYLSRFILCSSNLKNWLSVSYIMTPFSLYFNNDAQFLSSVQFNMEGSESGMNSPTGASGDMNSNFDVRKYILYLIFKFNFKTFSDFSV